MMKRGDEKCVEIARAKWQRENRRDNRNDGEVAPFVAIRGSFPLTDKQRGAKSVSRELLSRDEIRISPSVNQLQDRIRYFSVTRRKTRRT